MAKVQMRVVVKVAGKNEEKPKPIVDFSFEVSEQDVEEMIARVTTHQGEVVAIATAIGVSVISQLKELAEAQREQKLKEALQMQRGLEGLSALFGQKGESKTPFSDMFK